MKFQKQYLVKINYKSGLSEKTWYSKFNFDGKEYICTVVDDENNRPLVLGAPEIESVWVLKNRTAFVWS